jgi:hypothetical protein
LLHVLIPRAAALPPADNNTTEHSFLMLLVSYSAHF